MRRVAAGRGQPAIVEARHQGEACWPAVETETGSVLMLRDVSRDRDGSGRREAWRGYVGPERALMVFEWMSAQPGEWPLWGRVATLFGEAALHPIIVEAAERAAEEAAVAAESARLAEEDRIRRRRVIQLYILDQKAKRPGLSLESDDEERPFFVMRFSEKWERERVLDWLRWQGSQYIAFREICENEGAVALERLIIAGMRETEATARKQGLSSGGRRPLRFWRGEA